MTQNALLSLRSLLVGMTQEAHLRTYMKYHMRSSSHLSCELPVWIVGMLYFQGCARIRQGDIPDKGGVSHDKYFPVKENSLMRKTSFIRVASRSHSSAGRHPHEGKFPIRQFFPYYFEGPPRVCCVLWAVGGVLGHEELVVMQKPNFSLASATREGAGKVCVMPMCWEVGVGMAPFQKILV